MVVQPSQSFKLISKAKTKLVQQFLVVCNQSLESRPDNKIRAPLLDALEVALPKVLVPFGNDEKRL